MWYNGCMVLVFVLTCRLCSPEAASGVLPWWGTRRPRSSPPRDKESGLGSSPPTWSPRRPTRVTTTPPPGQPIRTTPPGSANQNNTTGLSQSAQHHRAHPISTTPTQHNTKDPSGAPQGCVLCPLLYSLYYTNSSLWPGACCTVLLCNLAQEFPSGLIKFYSILFLVLKAALQ